MANNHPAQEEIQKLLTIDHATLVRNKNHLVYKLSNGHTFVMSHTPSDHHSYQNHLSQLKRLLGVKKLIEAAPIAPVSEKIEEAVEAETSNVALPPYIRRLNAVLEEQEWLQEHYLEMAQQCEHSVNLLRNFQQFIGTESPEETESVLRLLVGEPPSKPPAPLLTAPPVTNRVQVTKELVMLAVEAVTLQSPQFSVTGIVERMTAGKTDNPDELRRVRSSIIDRLSSLIGDGKVIRTVVGIGRSPAQYAKSVQ